MLIARCLQPDAVTDESHPQVVTVPVGQELISTTHVARMVRAPNGDLIAPNGGEYLIRSPDNGSTWSLVRVALWVCCFVVVVLLLFCCCWGMGFSGTQRLQSQQSWVTPGDAM